MNNIDLPGVQWLTNVGQSFLSTHYENLNPFQTLDPRVCLSVDCILSFIHESLLS